MPENTDATLPTVGRCYHLKGEEHPRMFWAHAVVEGVSKDRKETRVSFTWRTGNSGSVALEDFWRMFTPCVRAGHSCGAKPKAVDHA